MRRIAARVVRGHVRDLHDRAYVIVSRTEIPGRARLVCLGRFFATRLAREDLPVANEELGAVETAAVRALHQAIARCGGAGNPQRLIRTALARAGLRDVPPDREALARFVQGHVVPLMAERLPSVQHGEARAAFARVSAILSRGSVPRETRDDEVTQEIVTRRFDEILLLTSDAAAVGALAEFAASGARVERFGSAHALTEAMRRARGAVLVILDVRLETRILRDALTSARPPSGRLVVVVWGDESAARQAIASLPGVHVARLPADATADDLRAVARLGAA